ncbi:MAG: LamG domain-containing protein [Kiritimatiellae bacterium]|nr:LamG domain-containing protein [Kiritimatiellia bacterium]
MKRIQIMAAACLCAVTAHTELVGYWNFDADNCLDQSGNGYYGTMHGGSYSADVPGKLGGGKSIDLTAGNHYVIIDSVDYGATEDPFNFNQSMTVSFWAKGWPAADWSPFVCKLGENAKGWQVRRYQTQTQVWLTLRGTTTGDLSGQTASASDGNWHHIAVSYNGYRQRIYVDGVLDRVNRATGSIAGAAERVVFGARERDSQGSIEQYSKVKLDDISIYSDALSESQIKFLAEGGSPTNVLERLYPIGYWSFDDSSISDSSGLGRHGALLGGGGYTNDVPAQINGGKSLDLRGGDYYALINSVGVNSPADPFSLGKNHHRFDLG